MSVLLYAFDSADVSAPDTRGLDDKPLRVLTEGELAAVVSDHDQPRLASSALSLWGYEQVMERLMTGRTLLPARFGTVLSDDDEVLALLHEHHEELTSGLERVCGAVELGTRARWRSAASPPGAPASEGGPGTAYLAGRVAVHRRAQDLARRLDPLADFAREARRRVVADDEFPVRDAYLVDRDRLAGFAHAVRELDERDPEIEMVCTGPWPPYSFARALDLAAVSGGST